MPDKFSNRDNIATLIIVLSVMILGILSLTAIAGAAAMKPLHDRQTGYEWKVGHLDDCC